MSNNTYSDFITNKQADLISTLEVFHKFNQGKGDTDKIDLSEEDIKSLALQKFINFHGLLSKSVIEPTPENIKLVSDNQNSLISDVFPHIKTDKKVHEIFSISKSYTNDKTFISTKVPFKIKNLKNSILHSMKDEANNTVDVNYLYSELQELTPDIKEMSEFISYTETNYLGYGKIDETGKIRRGVTQFTNNSSSTYELVNDRIIETKDISDKKETIDNFISTLEAGSIDKMKEFISTIEDKEMFEMLSTYKFIEFFKGIEFGIKVKYTNRKQKEFIENIVKIIQENQEGKELTHSKKHKISSQILYFNAHDSIYKTYTTEQKSTFNNLLSNLKEYIRKELQEQNLELSEEELEELISNLTSLKGMYKLQRENSKKPELMKIIKQYGLISNTPLINNYIEALISKSKEVGIINNSEEELKDIQIYTSKIAKEKDRAINNLKNIGRGNWMRDIEELNKSNERFGHVGSMAHQYYSLYLKNTKNNILNKMLELNYPEEIILEKIASISSTINKDGVYEITDKFIEEFNKDIKEEELKEFFTEKLNKLNNFRFDNFLKVSVSRRNEIAHEGINLDTYQLVGSIKPLFSLVSSLKEVDSSLDSLERSVRNSAEKDITKKTVHKYN